MFPAAEQEASTVASHSSTLLSLFSMKQIPNIITLLNLVFGCLAIVYAMQNGFTITYNESGETFAIIPEQIFLSSLFIGCAAVVDFFDGFVARLMKADSAMGKELDSLADVVSFGAAPAIIVYQFLRLSFAQQADGIDISVWWLLPAFILPCAAAYRLARFNLDTTPSFGFKGLPVPAAGLFIASFPLIYWNSGTTPWIVQTLISKWFWYAVILGVSYLMISTLPMMALKFKDFSVKNNVVKYVLVVLAAVLAFILGWQSIPIIFFVYVVLSLVTHKSA